MPEIIPVLGQVDEVIVNVLALRYVRRRLGRDELRRRWPGSEGCFAILYAVMGRATRESGLTRSAIVWVCHRQPSQPDRFTRLA